MEADELERYQHFPPFWTRSSIRKSAPLSAGGLRVQLPSGPPFFRSVSQSLERPAWDREAAGGNPAVPTNLNCCRGRTHEAPSSKRNDAGGTPAGSAIARWCQSSTTVC